MSALTPPVAAGVRSARAPAHSSVFPGERSQERVPGAWKLLGLERGWRLSPRKVFLGSDGCLNLPDLTDLCTHTLPHPESSHASGPAIGSILLEAASAVRSD